jgi:two-component system response regulator YesN
MRKFHVPRKVGIKIVTFLVPFLIISTIWFQTSSESIKEQVDLSLGNQLLQIKFSTENTFTQIDSLVQQIPYDDTISSYKLKHPYYGMVAQKDLSRYKLNNSFVDDLFLYYFDNPDELYTSRGTISLDNYMNNYRDEKNKEELIKSLEATTPSVVNSDTNNVSAKKLFSYTVPIKDNDGVIFGSITYSLKQSYINKLLEQSFINSEGSVLIISKEGNLLSSYNKDDATEQLLAEYKDNHKKIPNSFSYAGKSYTVKKLKDNNLDLDFIGLVNSNKALSQVNRMNKTFKNLFIIISLLGLFIIFIFGKHTFTTINNIERLMTNYFKDTKRNITNQKIDEQLSLFLNENNSLKNEIRLQTPHAKEQVLRKILNGRLKNLKELRLVLESVGITIDADRYFVVLIDAKDRQEKLESSISEDILQILNCVQGKSFIGYGSELLMTQSIAVLIGFNSGVEQVEIINVLQEDLKQVLGYYPKMGVGSIEKDLTKVNGSYIEALSSLEYSLLVSDNRIVFFSEIAKKNKESNIIYPEDKQLKLIQSLEQGDIEIARDTINSLIQQGIMENMTAMSAKMYGYYLLNTIVKKGSELCGRNIIEQVEQLSEFKNLRELEVYLIDLAEVICRILQEKPQNQESQLKYDLFSYIESHITSSQLSLENLAEHFEVSVSYLTRFIKKESGITFSKYVQKRRLEVIKKQLIETDLPIKEIIQNTGYCDVSNYTRKFKQTVGVTPGQYRGINKKSIVPERT